MPHLSSPSLACSPPPPLPQLPLTSLGGQSAAFRLVKYRSLPIPDWGGGCAPPPPSPFLPFDLCWSCPKVVEGHLYTVHGEATIDSGGRCRRLELRDYVMFPERGQRLGSSQEARRRSLSIRLASMVLTRSGVAHKI